MSLAIEADFLPPFNGLAPIEVVQEYYTTVSDSAAVSIVSVPGAFALYEDMKTLEKTLRDRLKELADMISSEEDTYSDKSTYAIGDYCIHNNQLYKCIVPIREPEEWTEEHWRKVTIIEELLYLANKEVEVVDPKTAKVEGLAADAKLTGNALKELSEKILSFEQAKSTIVNSALGRALSMAASNTWAQIVSKISNVVNRGAYSSTITTENGSVTIPAGYHNGSGKVTVSGLYKIVTIGTFKIISSGGFSVQKNVTSTVVFTDIIEDHSAFQLNSGKAYARVAMTKLQISMDYNFGNEYGNVTHKWTVNLYKNGSRISTISDSNVNSQGKGCIANFGTFSCNAGDYFYVVAIGSQDTYSEGAGDGHPSISNCVLNLTSQS